MQAVEDEQHFLFDCPFYSIIRGQHFSLFGPDYQQRDIRLFYEQNSHQVLLHTTYTYAFKPGWQAQKGKLHQTEARG